MVKKGASPKKTLMSEFLGLSSPIVKTLTKESGEYILTVEGSTFFVKTSLVERGGRVVTSISRHYTGIRTDKNTAEVDPLMLWEDVLKSIIETIRNSKINSRNIRAVGVSSEIDTIFFIGKNGSPIFNAILPTDRRSETYAQKLTEHFRREKLCSITGQEDLNYTSLPSKISWFSNEFPNLAKRVFKYLQIEDYILFKLTGKFVTEKSLASTSFLMDITEKKWWPEMLDFLKISPSSLPEILEPGERVGRITSELASATGLGQDTAVSTGAMHIPASMVGCGNIHKGILSEVMGNTLLICATVEEGHCSVNQKLSVQLHGVRDKYCLVGWLRTGGAALRWFEDNFYEKEMESKDFGDGRQEDPILELAGKVPAGSDGLILLPHFEGAGSPHYNPMAKAVFYGINLYHKKIHFLRAVMEGIAYALKANMDAVLESGGEVEEIRTLGDISNELWNQIKADVTGKPLLTMRNPHFSTIGTAILAGKAIGFYPSIEEGVKLLTSLDRRYTPKDELKQIYDDRYREYLKLYKKIFEGSDT